MKVDLGQRNMNRLHFELHRYLDYLCIFYFYCGYQTPRTTYCEWGNKNACIIMGFYRVFRYTCVSKAKTSIGGYPACCSQWKKGM